MNFSTYSSSAHSVFLGHDSCCTENVHYNYLFPKSMWESIINIHYQIWTIKLPVTWIELFESWNNLRLRSVKYFIH